MITKNFIFLLLATFFFQWEMVYAQKPKQDELKDSLSSVLSNIKNEHQKGLKYEEILEFLNKENKPDPGMFFSNEAIAWAKSQKNTSKQVSYAIQLGTFQSINGDMEWSLQTYQNTLLLAQKHHLTLEILKIKHRIAGILLKQNDKETAQFLLDSILKVAQKIKNPTLESQVLIDLGKLERANGNYKNSLHYFQQNLEIVSRLQNNDDIAYAYLQLGIDYGKTKDFQKSIAFNKKGINYALKEQNKKRISEFYNNIAVSFRSLKQYDSAFHYHKLVLTNQKLTHNLKSIALAYMNIGTTFSFQKDYSLAEKYYDSAYQTIKDKKNIDLERTIYQNYSALYQDKGDFQKSIQFGLKALRLLSSNQQHNELFNVYENLYQSYKGLKKSDSALYYFEKMVASKDSIFNFENSNSIETRKRQIDNFENQNKISELSKDNQLNKILLFSALGAFLSSIYIAYLFLKNSNRKKVLAQQKQAIEEQKVLTLIKNQEMQVINACVSGQEQERQSISEELHDNIGSDMATLKMHIENLLNQPTTPNTKEILYKLESIVDQSYQKIRNLSHLKSNTLVAQKGLELALEKLLNNINSNDQTLVKIELFGFDKDMKDESKVLIYNTLQELISNAIKHAKATQINAQITNFDHEFNILVEDNGSGFDYSDKILEKGMGLYNLKRKIEHLGGTFLVDSFKGKGTTINIDIPI